MTSTAITTLDQAANARARLEAERDEILDRKRDLMDDKGLHVMAAALGDRVSSSALAEISAEEKALDERLATLKAALAELDRIEEPLRARDLAEYRKAQIFEAYQAGQDLVANSTKFDAALAEVGKWWAERQKDIEKIRRLAVHDGNVMNYLSNHHALNPALAASPLAPLFPTMFFGPTTKTLAESDREHVRLPGEVERIVKKERH